MERKELEYLPEGFYKIIDFLWEHPKWGVFLCGLFGFLIVGLAVCAIAATII